MHSLDYIQVKHGCFLLNAVDIAYAFAVITIQPNNKVLSEYVIFE